VFLGFVVATAALVPKSAKGCRPREGRRAAFCLSRPQDISLDASGEYQRAVLEILRADPHRRRDRVLGATSFNLRSTSAAPP